MLRYTCWGPKSGGCGQLHARRDSAERHLAVGAAELTDRRVVVVSDDGFLREVDSPRHLGQYLRDERGNVVSFYAGNSPAERQARQEARARVQKLDRTGV